MKSSEPIIALSALVFTEKGTGGNVYPSATIPAAIRTRLSLRRGAAPLYFQQFLSDKAASFHVMRQGTKPGFSGPYTLQRSGAVALPPSFVEQGDRSGSPVKLAFLEKDTEAAIIGRLDCVVVRLGRAALEIGADRAIGNLLVANFTNRTFAEVSNMDSIDAGVNIVSTIVQRAFPEAWDIRSD